MLFCDLKKVRLNKNITINKKKKNKYIKKDKNFLGKIWIIIFLMKRKIIEICKNGPKIVKKGTTDSLKIEIDP